MGDLAAAFDGSLPGFLSVVHAWYYDKLRPLDVVWEEGYQPMLGAQYIRIPTDEGKAHKVQQGIQKKISPKAWDTIYRAYLASEPDRFIDMLRYLVLGFACGAAVDDRHAVDYVFRVHKLARYVGGEAHLLTGLSALRKQNPGCIMRTSGR